jgi:hypothetical protein
MTSRENIFFIVLLCNNRTKHWSTRTKLLHRMELLSVRFDQRTGAALIIWKTLYRSNVPGWLRATRKAGANNSTSKATNSIAIEGLMRHVEQHRSSTCFRRGLATMAMALPHIYITIITTVHVNHYREETSHLPLLKGTPPLKFHPKYHDRSQIFENFDAATCEVFDGYLRLVISYRIYF